MGRDVIILLGSPNSDQGELYSIAKERCTEVLKQYDRHPTYKILLTGGYGAHFNTTRQPHAWYLKRYLLHNGIPENQFTEFAESTNTLEDATLSKAIVLKYYFSNILVVTSDYHLTRAKYIFEKGYADVSGELSYIAVATDESACEIDLLELKRHEITALEKLKQTF
jgi:uncharacterized SAM-binding protein YcdF (DUF218 family)